MNNLSSLINESDHDGLYNFYSRELKLFAVIAIHKKQALPAIGGCRCIEYPNYEAAIEDALLLSSAMSQKSEFHDLGHGGGKMVVALPKTYNKKLIMEQIGRWVELLGGEYITASDSGTTSSDMNIISKFTNHVASPNRWPQYCPSYYTALGVYSSIKACKQDLTGKIIMIQGAGEVGRYLIPLLLASGAKIKISDLNHENIEYVKAKYSVEVIAPEDALTTECDILAPCALGGVLNPLSMPKIKAKLIIGAANNQFSNTDLDAKLARKLGITIVPDYIANGGGLIHVAGLYAGKTKETIEREVMAIGFKAQQTIESELTTC